MAVLRPYLKGVDVTPAVYPRLRVQAALCLWLGKWARRDLESLYTYPSLGVWDDVHNGVEQRVYVVRIHHELGRGKNNGERKKTPREA